MAGTNWRMGLRAEAVVGGSPHSTGTYQALSSVTHSDGHKPNKAETPIVNPLPPLKPHNQGIRETTNTGCYLVMIGFGFTRIARPSQRPVASPPLDGLDLLRENVSRRSVRRVCSGGLFPYRQFKEQL